MPRELQNYSIEDFPNGVNVKFQFTNEDYEEFKNLANKLDISLEQLIVEFFQEGVSLMWDSFEYEAKKSKQ